MNGEKSRDYNIHVQHLYSKLKKHTLYAGSPIQVLDDFKLVKLQLFVMVNKQYNYGGKDPVKAIQNSQFRLFQQALFNGEAGRHLCLNERE